jgi:hypothetical protein
MDTTEKLKQDVVYYCKTAIDIEMKTKQVTKTASENFERGTILLGIGEILYN